MVLGRVGAIEAGGREVELVAKDEDEVSGHVRRPLRQASEQCFTSSQLRAQAWRQVIARPQVTQGLVGRWALLPRNPADWSLRL